MQPRRIAREKALQFLFQYEINRPDNLEEALQTFWESQRMSAARKAVKGPTYGQELELPPLTTRDATIQTFAEALIRGAIENADDADEEIRRHAQNWALSRIATVDRSILRLAIHEIKHRMDIPPVVSINEAVDLAKKYSTEKSGQFVNGILDKVKESAMRPGRTASGSF
jgi:N utilization substance protein B